MQIFLTSRWNWSPPLYFPRTFKFLMMVLLSQLWFIAISLISFVVVFQIIGKFLKQKQLSILWNEIKEPIPECIVLFKCCYYASSKSTCLWILMKRILYFLSSLQFHKLKFIVLLLNRKIYGVFVECREKWYSKVYPNESWQEVEMVWQNHFDFLYLLSLVF